MIYICNTFNYYQCKIQCKFNLSNTINFIALFNNNNNNGSFIVSVIKIYKNLLFTGSKLSIFLHIFLFSVSTLFNSLCIYGIELFLCLSVKHLLITNFSLSLLLILWACCFLGNIDLNFSTWRHFLAKLRHRESLLSSKDCRFKTFNAFL